MRRGDIDAIQSKVDECLKLALDALGGVDTVLGRELHKLAANFSAAHTINQLHTPLITIKEYLKAIQ
ncbi:hypothetical protein D3C76_1288770 [compost metagenome]